MNCRCTSQRWAWVIVAFAVLMLIVNCQENTEPSASSQEETREARIKRRVEWSHFENCSVYADFLWSLTKSVPPRSELVGEFLDKDLVEAINEFKAYSKTYAYNIDNKVEARKRHLATSISLAEKVLEEDGAAGNERNALRDYTRVLATGIRDLAPVMLAQEKGVELKIKENIASAESRQRAGQNMEALALLYETLQYHRQIPLIRETIASIRDKEDILANPEQAALHLKRAEELEPIDNKVQAVCMALAFEESPHALAVLRELLNDRWEKKSADLGYTRHVVRGDYRTPPQWDRGDLRRAVEYVFSAQIADHMRSIAAFYDYGTNAGAILEFSSMKLDSFLKKSKELIQRAEQTQSKEDWKKAKERCVRAQEAYEYLLPLEHDKEKEEILESNLRRCAQNLQE